MEEFEKWLSCVIDIEGKEWPAFSRFDTIDEDNAAADAWKAALEWVSKVLEEQCVIFDVGWFGKFIEEELKEE